ncbi:MAG: hypothetical protein Q7S32_03050 [bacterium]|nr:hypothetical protein [bacterium]
MCQAYEAERYLIAYSENSATIVGFKAARDGQTKDTNPHRLKYEREAWDHGWACWQTRLLPWALEKHYYSVNDYKGARQAREQFENYGTLPQDLEDLLE